MIKYECDNCHQLVNEAEMVSAENQFAFSSDLGMVFFVGVRGDSTNKIHFCKACMWKGLSEMFMKLAPEVVLRKFNMETIRGQVGVLMEVSNEPEPDTGEREVTDTLLHELHAKNILPESSAPEYPEDYQSPGSQGIDGDTF